MVANGAALAGALGHTFGGEALEGRDELGTMAVECFEVGFVGCQAVVNRHLAAAGLIQDSDLNAVAEAGGAVAEDDINVLDETVVANIIVGDIVLDIFDAAVVADGDIMQCGVE